MNTKIHLVGKKNVFPHQIIFFKADANYTEVFLTNGQRIIISKTLKKIESDTEIHNFFRPHKSFLINLSHIKNFSVMEDKTISLTDDFVVELSRRKRKPFLKRLKRESAYIKGY